MTSRKLSALRALAERPGTEAEGLVARAMLERAERVGVEEPPEEAWVVYKAWRKGRASKDDVFDAMGRDAQRRRAAPFPTTWRCACGATCPIRSQCHNFSQHMAIQQEIRARFKKGDRVFYNYHAYERNCPATVVGYVRDKPENGSHPWAWITLKFDHLKANRQVPIISDMGWHLSHEPLDREMLRKLWGLAENYDK